jgi:hypothetical protein
VPGKPGSYVADSHYLAPTLAEAQQLGRIAGMQSTLIWRHRGGRREYAGRMVIVAGRCRFERAALEDVAIEL